MSNIEDARYAAEQHRRALLSQLQRELQQQWQELRRLRGMLLQLQLARQATASELADFSLRSGRLHLYRMGREMPLHPRQRQAIVSFEEKLAPHPCPCGGGDGDELLAVRDRYGIAINTVICRRCGLVRADPYYTDETLQSFYAHDYSEIYGRAMQNFQTCFAAAEKRNGTPIMQHLRQQGIPLTGRRIYEVGCGGGWCLRQFHTLGCIAIGVDYDEDMVRQGRSMGLDLRVGGPEQLTGEPPADIIILSHVLEHIPDPAVFLAQLRPLLAVEGRLYVRVPTLEFADVYHHHEIFASLQNAHVWYFSLPTLTAMLERAGFTVRRCDDSAVLVAVAPATERPAERTGAYAHTIRLLRRAEYLYWQRLRARHSWC